MSDAPRGWQPSWTKPPARWKSDLGLDFDDLSEPLNVSRRLSSCRSDKYQSGCQPTWLNGPDSLRRTDSSLGSAIPRTRSTSLHYGSALSHQTQQPLTRWLSDGTVNDAAAPKSEERWPLPGTRLLRAHTMGGTAWRSGLAPLEVLESTDSKETERASPSLDGRASARHAAKAFFVSEDGATPHRQLRLSVAHVRSLFVMIAAHAGLCEQTSRASFTFCIWQAALFGRSALASGQRKSLPMTAEHSGSASFRRAARCLAL